MRVRRAVALALFLVLALLAAGCAGQERAQRRTTTEAKQPVPPPRPEETITVAGVNEAGRTPKGAPRRVAKVAPLPPPARDTSGEESVVSPGAPSDAEIKRELEELGLAGGKGGGGSAGQAGLTRDKLAIPPAGAPAIIRTIIRAGNRIAKAPYVYGGGHGKWVDSGYDCSGSMSFALAAAGLLKSPLNSSGFMRWGAPGPGKWVTIYTNPGHAFMVVAGLRFDTSGARQNGGSRWQTEMRSGQGYTIRHPPGL